MSKRTQALARIVAGVFVTAALGFGANELTASQRVLDAGSASTDEGLTCPTTGFWRGPCINDFKCNSTCQGAGFAEGVCLIYAPTGENCCRCFF